MATSAPMPENSSNASTPPPGVRKFPRILFATPVEVRGPERTSLGQTANMSLGGVLIVTPKTASPESEVSVRFNLPTGHSVQAEALVVHAQPDVRMGVRFLRFPEQGQRALAEFVERILDRTRRSARVPRRLHVLIRRVERDRQQEEELAETVLIAQHGGLLMCRARFKLGERFYLWWPERRKGAHAKVVFRVVGGVGGLVEMGFEFEDTANFWETQFPPDTPLWRRLLDPNW